MSFYRSEKENILFILISSPNILINNKEQTLMYIPISHNIIRNISLGISETKNLTSIILPVRDINTVVIAINELAVSV